MSGFGNGVFQSLCLEGFLEEEGVVFPFED